MTSANQEAGDRIPLNMSRETEMQFVFLEGGAVQARTVNVSEMIIAGWTGRDSQAVERHIAELEAMGVPRPRSTPCFYRVSVDLLTTKEHLQVVGWPLSGASKVPRPSK